MYNAGKYTYGEILPIKSIYGTLDNDKKEKVTFKAYLEVTCDIINTTVIVTNGLKTYKGFIDSSGYCIIEIEKAGTYFIVGKHGEKESIPEQIEIRDNSHLYEFDIEIDKPEPQPISYIIFSSAEPFTLGFTYKAWDGIIEFSTDTETWEEWDALTVLSSNSENKLYIRGIGNTKMYDYDEDEGSFVIEATSGVACSGNIEFLLDYQTVLNGQHPIMGEHCFRKLFSGCSMLTTSPDLTADVLSPYCYDGMFYGCNSLRVAPALPATILAEGCYSYMFEECENLTTAPLELPATTLAIKCYKSMFESCSSLANAPLLPATIMAESCYDKMFVSCSSLTTAPILSATTLAVSCYEGMFSRCTSLITAPELPAIVLEDSCYDAMFYGCTSLTNAPELPATTLVNSCYRLMFAYCSSLVVPPVLSATVLAERCYENMFLYCTALTITPILPATTMYKQCYSGMFADCTSLTTATSLPSTTLADSCYNAMFYGCTSLTEVPELPATTLADNCYAYMFRDCTSLTTPSALPAQLLTDGCYALMFMGCSSIKLSTVQTDKYTIPYRIPVEGEGTNIYYGSMNGMFRDTGGTFTGTPIINTTYYLWNPITYLTFSSDNSFTLGLLGNHKYWNGTVEYSLDKSTWLTWYGSSTLSSNNNNELYLRGINNTTFVTQDPTIFVITSTSGVDCIGNIENLLDYQTVLNGQHPAMDAHCFRSLFFNCTSLTTAPELPATTLSAYCYSGMFSMCTSLTAAPELPATTLADYCYNTMFSVCTSLTTVPTLTAITLANYCYNYMFNGCSSLATVPELPATILSEGCYRGMFYGCTSLTIPSTLPAITLAEKCYESMFNGCTSIKISETQTSDYNIPYRIPTTGTGITATNSLYQMFYNIGGTFTGTPTINTTYYLWNPITYLTFSSDDPFTLGVTGKYWDGKLEYSTDTNTWTTWYGSSTLSSNNENKLYLRGSNNTRFATSYYPTSFVITSTSGVACTGNIENLLDYQTVLNGQHPVMAARCFRSLFLNCTSLTDAPELPATRLAETCYESMFSGCTSLTTAPQLIATSLSAYCYYSMFYGCTSLTTAPALPATTAASYCYNSMFAGCTSLTAAPELPATTLAESCYLKMFQGCTSLKTPPVLPATTLAIGCYALMFDGCTSIKLSATQTSDYNIPYRIPSTGTGTSAASALNNMFSNTGGTFTSTPTINTTYYLWNPITYLTFSSDDPFTLGVKGKYWNGTVEYSTDKSTWTTWDGSSSLSSNNENELYLRGSNNRKFSINTAYASSFILTATSGVRCDGNIENLLDYTTVLNGQHPVMAENCYASLFYNCTSLVSAPTLPATTLAANCYNCIFYGCTSLTAAPSLPATTLAEDCYHSMFQGCTSLTTAPALPATTLAVNCYKEMFKGCTSLVDVTSTLSATTFLDNCCYSMFEGCTSLLTAPDLIVNTLANSCCTKMFYGCTALTTPPVLSATTLADSCYSGMFYGCTSLATLPVLPATALSGSCYSGMFQGCTSIKLSETQTDKYTEPYRIPSSGTGSAASYSLYHMFSSTGGTFTGTPEINTTYYLWNPITYLTFSSDNPFTLGVRNKVWDGTLEYSTDKSTWTTWDGSTAVSSNNSNELYLRGAGNTKFYDITSNKAANFVITSTSGVNCSGNIENLLDYQTVLDGQHPTMGDYCYRQLFAVCTSLTTAPNLPATTLTRSCYESMFTDCTSLTTAPELPATTLVMYCYSGMFSGCTSLTTSPALPATTLANYCYYQMFKFCSALTDAPSLPATTVNSGCYQGMFRGCTSLTTAPSLPATTLGSSCYREMFYGCTSLTTSPVLPATTIIDLCYQNMFYGCTSLTTLPDLPATELKIYCYDGMFSGCTSIKLSETQTDEYNIPYRIPSTGTGVTANNALRNMFTNTGGTFADTPTINTTYYLWNPIQAVDFFITSYATYMESRGLENILVDNGTESSSASPMEKSSVRELANKLWEEYNTVTQAYNDIDAWMLDFLDDLSCVAQVGENVSFTMSQSLTEWFDNFADWVLGTKYGLTSTAQGYEHTSGSFDSPLVTISGNFASVPVSSNPASDGLFVGSSVGGYGDIYVSSTASDVFIAYYPGNNNYGITACCLNSFPDSFYYYSSTHGSGVSHSYYSTVVNGVTVYYTAYIPARIATPNSSIPIYNSQNDIFNAFVQGVDSGSTIDLRPKDAYTNLPIPVPDTSAQSYQPESLTGDWAVTRTSGMTFTDVLDEIVELVQSNQSVISS